MRFVIYVGYLYNRSLFYLDVCYLANFKFYEVFSLFFVIHLRATGLVVTQRSPCTSSALARV